MDYSVKISQVSSSGKTVVLNKGLNDRIKTDDYGVLLKEMLRKDDKTGQSYTVYKPVAKLKAVRALSDISIWIAFRSFLPNELTKDNKLILLSETELLQGRRKLKVDRRSIVSKKSEIKENLKRSLKGDGESMANKLGDYQAALTLEKNKKHHDSDVTLIDLKKWENASFQGNKHYQGFYESPHAEVFRQRKRVHTFEKMVVQFVQKHSDKNFTKKKLYAEQKRDENLPMFQDRSLRGSVYSQSEYESELRRKRNERLRSDLLAQGEDWSDGYSDEELARLVKKIGVAKELERRRSITTNLFDYQAYASIGINMLDNENTSDQVNTQDGRYDAEAALEWFFLKRNEQTSKFAFEVSARFAKDSLSTGGFNAVSTEYSSAIHLNWYPFLPPNTVGDNIIYVGTFFRYGWATREIPSQNEQGNYQIYSFPGLRAGIKYNFPSGYGARVNATLENIQSDRLTKNEDGGELPDRVSHLDGKVSIGLSRFF
tara:strand:- start:235609 stop:237066 length:1458 start_codon:yes stop_codon:yes gene_type:complete